MRGHPRRSFVVRGSCHGATFAVVTGVLALLLRACAGDRLAAPFLREAQEGAGTTSHSSASKGLESETVTVRVHIVGV